MQSPFEKHPKTRRSWRAALALCTAFLFAGCSLDGASKQNAAKTPRGPVPPRTSVPMPPVNASQQGSIMGGWTLLDGRRMRLSDYRGQVVVLDMYATYCPPCKEEIPHLIALQRRYASKGLNIIGLNVGGDDDRVKVPDYVEELNIQYTLGNPDPELVQMLMGDNSAIPQTFVFDRQGRFLKRFVGYDETMPAELEGVIQTALATEAD